MAKKFFSGRSFFRGTPWSHHDTPDRKHFNTGATQEQASFGAPGTGWRPLVEASCIKKNK